ncbi:uncharacterized protein EKO05_0001673 [Ascochyta rabiei]|uniref:uncharacterized protein n=1 Tax=Didymella rabiei TaxID=5454 RepID=UPI002202CA54|nr:uncharacterized protein EKO05_0001673 [Ascochyta rabiei]UPX11048.1 hypothetical protein EKO05_0001673 [Ascochyta rabiei]
MRSSIACSRCRRSKTKCDNNGIRDSTGALAACRSCVAGNKVCDYPAPQPPNSSHSHRRESTVTTAGEEAPPKKRKRPAVPIADLPSHSKGALGTLEDAHKSPLLTSKVWDELWAIHEKHYATEFSFLHKRTFLGPLQRVLTVSSSEKGPDSQGQRSHDPALVLAFLTQTSPFHPELVAQTGKPYDTAEFYAAATRKYLNYDFSGEGDTALQQIQAFLMLGYYEWTACHSRNGYMLIRTAVNFAQMNDYQYDEDLEKGADNSDAVSKRDRFIKQESRRRTFWSCFILDRYLSVGRRRPKILQVEDMRSTIQIPCSDKNFMSGRAVKTRFYGETDTQYEERRRILREEALRCHNGQKPEKVEWEDREDDGVLGRYIFALDHFSDVTKWANKGGRRSERPSNMGPWNPDTTYYKLDKRLREIKDDLPDELRLTPLNTENHIYGAPSGTSRTYFLIHAILTLSTTYLAPEYLATFPFRLPKPQGPLDEPLVTEPLPSGQPNYWVEKAAECFEYVRDFVSILQSFKERNHVVESPIVGHAIYKAAWCACYCHHVPRMDPTRALDSRLEPNAWDITNEVMDSMKRKFRIANIWSVELARVKAYYTEKRKEYKNAGGSPESTTSDNGGGLKIYSELFEAPHKQFGSLRHDKQDLTQPNDRPYSKLEHEEESEEPTTTNSPDVPFKTESEELQRSNSASTSIKSTTFTPVNPTNVITSVQTNARNNASIAPNNTRASYGPPVHQGSQQPQQPQPYPSQPLHYEQSSGYVYSASTPAYSQHTPQYNHHQTYAQTSGPTQGPVSSSYDPQALINLEKEGNKSIVNTDLPFFEGEWDLSNQQSVLAPGYPYNQFQPPTQYMPDSQGPYMYSGPWTGAG